MTEANIHLLFTILLVLAYLFAMISFVFKNAFLLRVIFIVSSLFSIAAGTLMNLYLVAIGNLMILVINLTLIIIIYLENRPAKLSSELSQLYQDVFYLFSASQLMKLSKHWYYQQFKKDDLLTIDGQKSKVIYLVINGSCDVIKNGNVIAEIDQYQFVGEMQWLTKSSAIAKEDLNCIVIDISIIEMLKNKDIDIYTIMSERMVLKVKKMNLSMIGS
ncbi:hypothetical protein L3V82_06360 [Thiotrichales bacterium 19S3-7]|nr:hypothetical protein [Thiotrichales bacterium 19S3-7]MCF6801719.1 hypothetical protein [Thiotrichales bacterium 19S3-11]